MQLLKDRCLKCRAAIYRDPDAHPWGFVGNNPPPPQYWYCSESCYLDAVDDLIEYPKFKTRSTVRDAIQYYRDNIEYYEENYSEDFMRKLLEEAIADWQKEKPGYVKEAKDKLKRKLEHEAEHQKHQLWLKDQEEWAKERKKDWDDLQKSMAETARRKAELDAFEELVRWRDYPEHLRIHTAIIAKTGWGKTQLLQHLILRELQKRDPPSLVIVDSTGAMTDSIQRLAIFNDRLRDRLLIIDPAHSPALNMFDFSNPRYAAYSPEAREAVQAELINLFSYIFSSKDYDLTGQQGLGFAYAVRLVLSFKGTITDLRQLLEETPKQWRQSKYADAIAALDPDARDFFEHHFYSDSLRTTRGSIARRLHTIIAMPAFRRMFTAPVNALDLYTETQERGRIILVNTNQRLLGREEYILFGRYIVARTFAAMLERGQLPQSERRTTHLLIDEAAGYFDEKFDELLTQVRQYGLKVSIAFQHLDQLDDKLKNAVAGQTSVKYVGGLSPIDERRIAPQIRCDPSFLAELRTDTEYPPQWSEWAVYVDSFTRHPMKLKLPFFGIDKIPRMTEAQHTTLIEENRRRVSPEKPRIRLTVEQMQEAANAPAETAPTSQPDATGRDEARKPPDSSETGSTW